MQELEFRQLTFDEFKTLVQWAELEGWNPGIDDAELFWQTDPDGFYGCFIEKKLIGGGSIVSYSGNFGFMGFFIVLDEYRNAGIGKQLWHKRKNTLLSRLKPGAAIGMDGVVSMQPFYAKGGFAISYKDIRYEKLGCPYPVIDEVSALQLEDIDQLLVMDKACFGFDRSNFTQNWIRAKHAKTFKYKDSDGFKGFAVLRKCVHGYKIGPLFAENQTIASALYEKCLNEAIGELVYLDIPTSNESAVNMIEKYEAKYVFECARMYLGEAPNIELSKVFGVTTFELG
jgi:hypothetical protein